MSDGGKMAKKKPTRKELLKEPDEFLSFSRKMLVFAADHKKQIIVSASVFFGLLVAIAGYRYYEFQAEKRAFALLQEATGTYAAAAAGTDTPAALKAASGAFERLFERYPGKAATRIGRVLYADIAYRAGDPKTAVELYARALESFEGYPALRSLIQSGLGYAQESAGNLEAAAASFRKVAEGQDAIFKDDAVFQLARINERMGRSAEGAALYEEIPSTYPDSMFAEIAREKAVLTGGG
jgi:tetratricopeptide (TPR) repeat protein